MNRLSLERSPYLLQHANNPVDWYPWGDAAFARARSTDRPIFLSIGYSTCHWCHVMEHESFEDPAIAAELNEHFVAIKVDREERPDVDRVHMAFVQGTTGSGGWPMSVWLTPDLKPFFGGTYFPPAARWGRPGFLEVLQQVVRFWRTDRAGIEQSAESIVAQLRGSVHAAPAPLVPGPDALRRIVDQFRTSFDTRRGGFGEAPKFPRPSELLFLLREHARTRDPGPLQMVVATLRAMALGGMRDHIGGGFHRYAVDAGWRVPHFEKMLYDQAQLTLAYLEAAQASGDRFLLEVAEDTLYYVMREMTDAGGGFYSAEDADSVPPEREDDAAARPMEGAFYLWRTDEVDALVGKDAALVRRRFGMEERGNAPEDPQEEFRGKNILYVARSVPELAQEFDRPVEEVTELLEHARLAMFRNRIRRPRPPLDDKVLTSWNGLMIAGFARAARLLRALGAAGDDDPIPYLTAAQRAAAFIRERLWDPETETLRRRFRDGDAAIDGYAEDYAFLIFGLLELFQADGDPAWLNWAVALQHRQDALFWDEEHGGWFSTTGGDPNLIARLKDDYDGAEPTAGSVSVFNLLALSQFREETSWGDRARRTLRLFGPRLEQMGHAVPMMAAALSTYVAGLQQVVVVDGEGAAELERMVCGRYRPFVIALSLSDDQREALAGVVPWVAGMRPVDGHSAAYICRNFSCLAPVVDPAALDAALQLPA